VVWMHHEAETNRRDFTNQQKKHASKKWRFGDMAVSWLTRQKAEVLTDSFVLHQEQDTDAARFDLQTQEVTYGDCVFTVILQHEDPATLEAQVQEVTRVIRGRQLTAVVERANATAALLNSWPGMGLHNPRHFKLSSLNGLHLFSPWSTPWAGQPRTPALHAPALSLMQTETCMPFWLSLHVGDVGHTLCFAPSGAGKSTLMAFLVCQWLSRYLGARVFYLDVKRAARSLFLCLEAPYLDFARDRINLQPLGRVHEAHERAWALDWLLTLVEGSGVVRTPTVEQFLEWGLVGVAALSPHERTLTALRTILPRRYAPRRAEGVSSAELERARREQMAVCQALERYTGRGSYGYALDGDHDDVTDAPVQGFELLGLLDTPRLIEAVTSYLGHRFYQSLTGAPTVMVCDEAGQYLIHEGFRRQIDAMLRLGRDKKLALLLGTQEATDVLDSRLKTLLVNQCVTRLYPPNANALTGAARPAYDALGLGEPAITRISRATAKRDVYVQQQGVGEQLAHLPLSDVELAVVGSSSTEHHAAMDAILEAHGSQGFAERWLTHKGLPQAAERLRQIRKEIHGTAHADRPGRPGPRAVVPVLAATGD
jgi:type IV secretory pathway VirB4 component